MRKLHLCAFTFSFTDQSRHVREKEIKRQTLLELVDYVNIASGKFTEAVAEDIVFMLSNNLFRALPASKSHDVDNLDPDEEEPALEPAWPHLQVITSLSRLQGPCPAAVQQYFVQRYCLTKHRCPQILSQRWCILAIVEVHRVFSTLAQISLCC